MMAWAATVYLLCLLTSIVCALLLLRSFMRSRARILAWSAACFGLLAVNNLAMVLDILVFPNIDLSIVRTSCSLLAVATLLYGFIWELD
jgi:hypothetical protein